MRISDWSSDVCSSDLRVARCISITQRRAQIWLQPTSTVRPPACAEPPWQCLLLLDDFSGIYNRPALPPPCNPWQPNLGPCARAHPTGPIAAARAAANGATGHTEKGPYPGPNGNPTA